MTDIRSCVWAFDWHQDRWPWNDIELLQVEFVFGISRNFADLGGNNG